MFSYYQCKNQAKFDTLKLEIGKYNVFCCSRPHPPTYNHSKCAPVNAGQLVYTQRNVSFPNNQFMRCWQWNSTCWTRAAGQPTL